MTHLTEGQTDGRPDASSSHGRQSLAFPTNECSKEVVAAVVGTRVVAHRSIL